MDLSQQPGVPSLAVGVQSNPTTLPAQLPLTDFTAAVPVQEPAPLMQPLGQTAESSVVGERSQVGFFRLRSAGAASASAYGAHGTGITITSAACQVVSHTWLQQ